jgi:hypothetical protein
LRTRHGLRPGSRALFLDRCALLRQNLHRLGSLWFRGALRPLRTRRIRTAPRCFLQLWLPTFLCRCNPLRRRHLLRLGTAHVFAFAWLALFALRIGAVLRPGLRVGLRPRRCPRLIMPAHDPVT